MRSVSSHFQARASLEGRVAQEMAERVIAGCGFSVIGRNTRRYELGVTVNLVATDARGGEWCFDVSGAFTSQRAGLIRTDTMWKTLGRASLLTLHGVERIVLLTTNLPMPGSGGYKALRATQGRIFFDALEMLPLAGKQRLCIYARGDVGTRPLPGFFSSDDLYGARLNLSNALGADLKVPLAETGDPFGRLTSDPNMQCMPHRLKVFLPSQDRNGSVIGQEVHLEVLRKTQEELADLSGGFTTNEARGHWIDPIGGIADERVIVLEAYSTQRPRGATIRTIVRRILDDLDQAAAAIVFDDHMYHFRR